MRSMHCNYNPETTVFCHINSADAGKGMGLKASDLFGFYGCSECHNVLDGRTKSEYNKEELDLLAYHALIRTQMILINKGLIKIS